MSEAYSTRPKPCPSCPYRKKTPSGVWDASEYRKLKEYDGEVIDQLRNGGVGIFRCHQNNGKEESPCLCRGWTDCHGAHNLAAIRLTQKRIPDDAFDHSGDDVFSSGEDACRHGMRDISDPSDEALAMQQHLLRKNERLKTLDED